MLSGNSLDYADRKVDLLLLKAVLAAPAYKQRVDLDVETYPMIVTGVEKLVQMYALVLITELGSCHFDESRGTRIVTEVSKGKVYDMPTLTAAASEANAIAKRQLRAVAEKDTPADERLANSEVIHLEFDRSNATARISVRITTEAGTSFEYIIPVGIGVRS